MFKECNQHDESFKDYLKSRKIKLDLDLKNVMVIMGQN